MVPRELRSVRAVLLAVILGGLALGVSAQTDGIEEADGAEEARRAQVIARIDDYNLTVGSIEDELHSQTAFQRARFTRPARLREYVENLVRFELLAAEAERREFDRHPNVVKLAEQTAVQSLLRREFDERLAPEMIPREDVVAYYRTNRDQFRRPESRRAHHILLGDEETAREMLLELQGADLRRFRDLARERSLDTETKLRGGDLQYFIRDGRPVGARGLTSDGEADGDLEPASSDDPPVDEALAEAAFSVQSVGDLCPDPIPIGDKFSVLMLTGQRPAERRTLAQAEESIRLRLFRQRRQHGVDDFVQALRQRYQPVVHPERLDPIRLSPPSEDPPQERNSGDGPGDR